MMMVLVALSTVHKRQQQLTLSNILNLPMLISRQVGNLFSVFVNRLISQKSKYFEPILYSILHGTDTFRKFCGKYQISTV